LTWAGSFPSSQTGLRSRCRKESVYLCGVRVGFLRILGVGVGNFGKIGARVGNFGKVGVGVGHLTSIFAILIADFNADYIF